MTRGDFAFVWHYRDSDTNSKAGRHLLARIILSKCGCKDFIPNNTPAGVNGALNSMEPESYEYVQNVHGYSVREPKRE